MAAELKAEGNDHFKAKRFKEAVAAWTKAVAVADPELQLVLHRNIAQGLISLNKFEEAVAHCTKVLDVSPNDEKALFRRGLAQEKLGKRQDAFRDMAMVTRLYPKNGPAKAAASRLMGQVQAEITKSRSTKGVTDETLNRVLDTSRPLVERHEACKNLVAVACDGPAAAKLFAAGGVDKLLPLIDSEDAAIRVPVLRAFGALSQDLMRAKVILTRLSTKELSPRLMALISSKHTDTVRAAVGILAHMCETFSSDTATQGSDKEALKVVIQYFLELIPHRNVTADARDAAIGAIVKNARRANVGKIFLDLGGVAALLITASCTKSPLFEDPEDADISMSRDTRMHVSVALAQVFEATTVKGTPDERFAADCLKSAHFSDDPVSNIPAVYALTAVIQAVIEVGNQILEGEGVMDRLLAMAQSSDKHAQCAAAEALAHAASDKKRCRGVLTEGFAILKGLYSKDLPEPIRVRALVGLCKMGSQNAGAVNQRTLAEGAVVNLAKKLRPFLVGDDTSQDTRKWAGEGLAYLTLDADVKEFVVKDDKILKAMHKLAIEGDKTVQYSIANMLVNLTNSFDKPEETEEKEQLKKLGKFAGENIPEPHPLDADSYAEQRVQALIKHGFIFALANISKGESENAREQVARVLLAMVEKVENRGTVIQQGGSKALLNLARDSTPKGVLKAGQALAKLAITSDPAIAFPGQRVVELVKPLINLGKQQHGLLQFESCMALCNLASMTDELRNRIVREGGLKLLEDLMFDDDTLVRRAACEAMCNMLYLEKVFDMFATKEGSGWGRLKLWILLAGSQEEDMATARACAGGLAILSSSEEVLYRIKEEKQGFMILRELTICPHPELQHRALHIFRAMVQKDDLARAAAEDGGLEMFAAVHQTTDNAQFRGMTKEVLDRFMALGLVKDMEEARRKAQEWARRQAIEEAVRKAQEEKEQAEAAEEEEEEEGEEVAAVEEEEPEELEPGIEEIDEEIVAK